MELTTGTLIAGRFRIASIIGSGGAGTVFKAIQEPLDRPVALKMLRSDLSRNERVRQRFVREGRSVAALSHPNIAMVLDFGAAEDGQLYLAMELVEGVSLADMLGRQQLPFSEIRQIFEQLLAGLAHAHARGVVHRDIKPGNVLLTSDSDGNPHAKIVDFGIATYDDERQREDLPAPGRIIGTPLFMAPEQARGDTHLTPAADLYTVGLMLFWAVTGRHAFTGSTADAILYAQVNAPTPQLVPRPGLMVPPGLEALVYDALEKDPAKRIGSANAFRTRLRALSGAAGAMFGRDSARFPALPARTAAAAASSAARPATIDESALPRIAQRAATFVESLAPRRHVRGNTFDEAATERGEESSPAHVAAQPAPRPSLADSPSTHPSLRPNAPLVGRSHDRSTLMQSALAVVSSGNARIQTIEAQTGMGKSRLALWLRDELASSMAFRHASGLYHREGERGLRGLREAFDNLLGVRELHDDHLARELSLQLRSIGLHEHRDHLRVASFLRPSHEASTLPQDDAEGLYELLLRILERRSLASPILLLLDDAQFAGPETSAFLEYAATELTQRPARLLLLVVIQIDEPHEHVEELLARLSRFDGSSVARHRMERLSDDEAGEVISSLINASPDLIAALVRRADGNPLHLVQLVRYLSEERLLEFSSAGWATRPGVDVNQILPRGIADIVAMRLSRLSGTTEAGARARDLLDRCAILGARFSFRELQAMLAHEEREDLVAGLDTYLDLLLDEELLRMTETREDDLFAFPNGLIRDVVLDRLKNRRTSRSLHLHAALARIAIAGEGADAIAADLVEHFALARERSLELQYAERAARFAERSHRPNDALAFWERTLGLLLENAEPDADTRARCRAVRLKLAQLSLGFGNYPEARRHFAGVHVDPTAPLEDRIAAAYGEADVVWVEGDFDSAAQLYAEGVDLAGELPGSGLSVKGLLGLARMDMHRGDTDAAERRAEEARAAADPDIANAQYAEVLWLIADIARASGDLPRAEQLFHEALDRFRDLEDTRGIAQCYAKLAVTARMQNDLDNATRRYHAALDLYAALGARRGVAHQLNGLGDVARFRNDLPLAAEHYQRAVTIFESIGVPFDAAIALTNLGIVARDAGKLAEASSAFARAVAVSERIHYPYLLIGAKVNWAAAEALAGNRDAAETLLRDSLTELDTTGFVDPDYALPLELIGTERATAGDKPRATQLLERARDMWAELKRETDVARTQQLLESLR